MTLATVLRTVSSLLVLLALTVGAGIGVHRLAASAPQPAGHSVLADENSGSSGPDNTVWG